MTIATKNPLALGLVLVVAASLLAPSTVPAADLVGLELLRGEDAVRVELSATGEFRHRAFQVDNPDRYVVDILGTVRQVEQSMLAGDGELVSAVRCSQYRGAPNPVTRVVVDLLGDPRVFVETHDTGLAIVVSPAVSELEQLDRFEAAGVAADPSSALSTPRQGNVTLEGDRWQSSLDQVASTGSTTQDASYSRTMSINMQNADIRTILRAIADFSGRNIIASPLVVGQVTVALTDVPWIEALGVILRANGFGYKDESGIIRVDTAENLRNEELEAKSAAKKADDLEALVTQVVPIDFANAEEIKTSVESMLTNRGSVEVDDRTNSLIVTDIPGSVQDLAVLARELDTKTPQVHIDALLVDMDSRKSQEIGIDWGLLNVQPGSMNAAGDAVVTSTIADPVGQVRVGSVQNFGEIRATVQALARQNIADIISNPRITTTNNREANILVGQKIPLITTDVAGNPITRLETIGIRLIVTPHINSDSQITLDVHPEVSDLSSQATVQGGVIINTSEADTRVLVDNGDTAVIGGLIRGVTTRFESGVPVLKDMPLIGRLFRSESTNDEQRELVVFLTPTIVDENGVAEDRHWEIRDNVRARLEAHATDGSIE